MIAEPTRRDNPERVDDFVAAFRSFDRAAEAPEAVVEALNSLAQLT